MSAPAQPPLDKGRHLKYWQRCLRSLLPHQYTSNDSTRMLLGYFIIAAIDLLSAPSSADGAPAPDPDPVLPSSPLLLVTRGDRRRFREWVLACQHPAGGFCGSPTHDMPRHEYEGYDFATGTAKTGAPGAANIAATSFALLLLALLAEGEPDGTGASSGVFAGVDRVRTLRYLRRLQRDDGSFGEVLFEVPEGPGGEHAGEGKTLIAGGRDMRHCYFAAVIRWMLRGDVRPGQAAWVEDIDVDGLVAHIRRGQVYDGGIAESSAHESHAGYSFCAISALSLLDRPPDQVDDSVPNRASQMTQAGIPSIPAFVHSLVSRQFVYFPRDPTAAGDDPDSDPDTANFVQPASLSASDVAPDGDDGDPLVGFNGRCNKVADTCYCWWVAGALAILGQADLVEHSGARRFLLEKTQHLIGGFSKHPGGPPDVYHGFLGLAALATMRGGEPGLKAFDPALCVSTDAVRKIVAGRAALLRAAIPGPAGADETSVSAGDDGSRRLWQQRLMALAEELDGGRPEWLAGC